MKRLAAWLLTLALIVCLVPMTVGADTNLKSGSIVKFGSYEQDNKKKNGKEDIEWIVLGVTKDKEKAVLISRYCLDCVPFHNKQKGVTWEKSYVRSWLNDTFLEEAFTASQQRSLYTIYSDMEKNPKYGTSGGEGTEDLVTLLSIQEAEVLFKNDEARRCKATAYAKAQGTQVYDTGAWWRLRSPGQLDTGAASVYASGKIAYEGDSVWDYGCGIRPVIMVSLSAL